MKNKGMKKRLPSSNWGNPEKRNSVTGVVWLPLIILSTTLWLCVEKHSSLPRAIVKRQMYWFMQKSNEKQTLGKA
jgi:hypothetical protein